MGITHCLEPRYTFLAFFHRFARVLFPNLFHSLRPHRQLFPNSKECALVSRLQGKFDLLHHSLSTEPPTHYNEKGMKSILPRLPGKGIGIHLPRFGLNSRAAGQTWVLTGPFWASFPSEDMRRTAGDTGKGGVDQYVLGVVDPGANCFHCAGLRLSWETLRG